MYTQPKQRRFEELTAYEIITGPNAKYIILFHGYGANAYDLMPLSQVLLPKHSVNWLFPDGLISVDIGFGMVGKAWFPIDIAAFERAMTTGEYRDLSQSVPTGFAKARDAAREMLDSLQVPMERIILGGFSQGAMLATDLSLRLPKPPAALLLLSGTLVDAENWRKLAEQRAGLKFFQSHGAVDPLLPFAAAEKLNKMLNDAGLHGEFLPFHGGHEIPQDIILKLNTFLENIV